MEFTQKEEGMRKAYLALLTGFIMSGGCAPTAQSDLPQAEQTATGSASTSSAEKTRQNVKYMVSPAGEGSTAPTTQAFSAYNAINRGTLEKDAAEFVAPVTLESGKMYFKGGIRRVYYKIGPNTQFWIDIKGDLHPVVMAKGPLEAKQEWKRFNDDTIEVAGVTAEKPVQ